MCLRMIDKVRSGEKIKEVMRRSKISVEDLQKELGFVWPQSIYKWFRGESLPSVDNLYTICRLTGVHMEDLLVEEDKK